MRVNPYINVYIFDITSRIILVYAFGGMHDETPIRRIYQDYNNIIQQLVL